MKQLIFFICAFFTIIFTSCDKPHIEEVEPDDEDKEEPIEVHSLLALAKECMILNSFDNGLTWKESHIPESIKTYNGYDIDISDAIYKNGKWITVGGFGSGAVHVGHMMYSEDNGNNWINLLNPSTSKLYDINYGNGQYVAVGDKKNIIISSDGLDWKKTDLGALLEYGDNTRVRFSHVAIGDGSIVIGGTVSFYSNFGTTKAAVLIESNDKGKTWSSIKGFNGTSINSLAYGDGQFMATCSGAFINKINGVWGFDNRSGKSRSSGQLYYFDKTFATIISNQGFYKVAFTKGNEWVESNHSIMNLYTNSIMRGNQNYVLIGSEKLPSGRSQAAIYTSEDGLTWTPNREWLADRFVGRWCSFKSGLFAHGRYNIVGSQERIPGTPSEFYSSKDGLVWEKSDIPVLTKEQQVYKIVSN